MVILWVICREEGGFRQDAKRGYYNIEVSELLNGSNTDDIIRNIMCDVPWAMKLLPEEHESSNKSNEMSNMNGNNSNRGKRKRTSTGKRTDGLSRLAKMTATSRISRTDGRE